MAVPGEKAENRGKLKCQKDDLPSFQVDFAYTNAHKQTLRLRTDLYVIMLCVNLASEHRWPVT